MLFTLLCVFFVIHFIVRVIFKYVVKITCISNDILRNSYAIITYEESRLELKFIPKILPHSDALAATEETVFNIYLNTFQR